MANTSALITAVLRMAPSSISDEKARSRAARAIAPIAPIDAASVGVARPARIAPSTATISIRSGTKARTKRRPNEALSASSISSAGQLDGRTTASTRT
jgi:hypothetical protein